MTTAVSEALVSLDDLRAAAAVLRGVIVHTPLLPSESLSELLGLSLIHI